MKISAIGASVAVVVASVASADVTYTFTNQTWTALSLTQAYAAGSLTGTLTGVSVNATLNSSGGYAYADDLCVYMDAPPLSVGGLLQVGGYSNFSAAQRYFWANGSSSEPGTVVSSIVNLATGINMAANPTQAIYIGNGYGGSGSIGNWTGTITLIGVNVPAPGAVALLGLAGAIGGRRRRA